MLMGLYYYLSVSSRAATSRGAGPRPAAASQAAPFDASLRPAAMWGGQSCPQPAFSRLTPLSQARAGGLRGRRRPRACPTNVIKGGGLH
jgi:hypothetical protein